MLQVAPDSREAGRRPFPGISSVLHEMVGLRSEELESLLDELLGADARGTPCAGSTLNGDGSPVQLCIGLSPDAPRVRMLGDAGCELAPERRLQAAREAFARAAGGEPGGGLIATLDRLLGRVLPSGADALERYPHGVLWVARALGTVGAAAYITMSPWDSEAWKVAAQALGEQLPSLTDVESCLAGAGRLGSLASIAVEGRSPPDARCKLYWRLRGPAAIADAGIAPETAAPLIRFLATVMGDRAIARTGLVLSSGFALSDGHWHDCKADVCGCPRCLARPNTEWADVLCSLCMEHGLSGDLLCDVLRREARVEIALIGFGYDCHGRERLNVYLKERTVPCA